MDIVPQHPQQVGAAGHRPSPALAEQSRCLLQIPGGGVAEGAQFHGGPQAFPSAASTFCGVAGISSMRTPMAL